MPNGDQRYDTHDYAGDRADDVSIAMRRMPDEDRSTNAEIQQSLGESQREQLGTGVEMGDDRVVVPQNWDSRTSAQLYAAARNQNTPSTADNLGRGFTEGGNRLAEAANRLLDAVTALEHAWKGDAADAARGALTPLARRTGEAGMSAQFMGTAMSDQALAAAKVRTLPEPSDFDRDAAMTEALANPNPAAGMADLQAQEQAAKQVKAEQVRYLTEYTEALAEIDGRTPTFVPPVARPIDTGGGGGFQGGRGVDYPGGGGNGDQPVRGPGVPAAGPGAPGMGAPGGIFVPLPGENGYEGTDLSGFTQTGPQTGQPTINPAVGPTPTTGGLGQVGGAAPVGQFGGRGASGPGRGPGAVPARPATGGTGAGGPRPGAAPAAGRSGGAGGGASGGRPGGPGAPGAAGRGGAAGTGGAGRGGAGGAGAGRGGTAGRGGAMGSGAGARGDGEEDLEHQRPSYLVEPDAEATFGTDQITAPPVIGG